LDKFLASELCDFSRSKIQIMIVSGHVFVNDKVVVDANYHLKFKDEVSISATADFHDGRTPLVEEKDVEFCVLYEDEDVAVVNKPPGLVVHPGAGNYRHTLANGLAYRYGKESLSSGNGEGHRPGIVHRIDKDTSGILVIAKNDYAHAGLAEQFRVHSIKRKYVCFCYGVPRPAKGKIDTFIGRDRFNRLKMAVSKDSGKRAITFYDVLKSFSNFASKIKCELHTGRTHQIRVHMSHIGNSLIGDSIYGMKNYSVHANIPANVGEYVRNFPRQALHAYLLEFEHPKSKKIMRFEVDLPADMLELERILNFS
jgi:23S rRNA pseudouridine1911/1915/1917 synthase